MHQAIIHHLSGDPVMKVLIRRYALPTPQPRGAVYESVLRAIVGQQLSGKAAATIHGRFLALYGGACPPPAQLLTTSPDTLREAGLSRQKSAYLLAAAQWFALHPEEDFEQMSDEQVIQSLTQIRGVGRWTAEMVLMFTLGRPDVFPTDDLGIRKAMAMHYQLTETGKELVRRMDAIAQGWRPFRSWACFVLWKSLDS